MGIKWLLKWTRYSIVSLSSKLEIGIYNDDALCLCYVPVFHKDEIEDSVETGHHEIGQTQVDEKVVGHVLHPAMT